MYGLSRTPIKESGAEAKPYLTRGELSNYPTLAVLIEKRKSDSTNDWGFCLRGNAGRFRKPHRKWKLICSLDELLGLARGIAMRERVRFNPKNFYVVWSVLHNPKNPLAGGRCSCEVLYLPKSNRVFMYPPITPLQYMH